MPRKSSWQPVTACRRVDEHRGDGSDQRDFHRLSHVRGRPLGTQSPDPLRGVWPDADLRFMGAAYWFHISGVMLLVIVVAAIACYAMTLATTMWVIISEIFPNRIRGVAMSVCTFALWAACFILTYTFPVLNSGLGAAGTFWLYGIICLVGGIFVWRRLPETKGKSLEEIEHELIQ